MSLTPSGQWWADQDFLTRVVTDLLTGELRRLRPGSPAPLSRVLGPGLQIGAPGTGAAGPESDGLGADSLELVSLATALVEALHLHRSGIEDYLLVRRTLGEWIEICAAGLARFDEALTFRTSGSTGKAKSCTHATSSLTEEADFLAGLLGPIRRVVTLVPCHHIYGFLFTVMLPRVAGAPVVNARGRMPSRVCADLADGDLLVATPDMWAAVARSGAVLPSGAAGTSSTARLDAGVARAVRDQGLGRLVEVYGSSETGGIGWRDDADGPFHLFPYWELSQDGSAVSHVRSGKAGTLPDRTVIVSPGRFSLTGRLDAAVQVGGVNVFPGKVADVLQSHPDVAEAAVRAFPVEGGERLKAFVVLSSGRSDEAILDDLIPWAHARLTTEERPRSWTVGMALPRDPMGKLADWPLG